MLQPLHVLPMFGFAAFGCLMIGVVLAVAVWIAFRSGAAGTTKLGGFAGCMVAVALVFVAGLGALACIAVAAFNAPNEFVRNGPVRRFEAHWPELRHGTHSPKGESGKAESAKDGKDESAKTEESEEVAGEEEAHGLHLVVEVEGGDEAQIARWFRKHTSGDFEVSYEPVDGPHGRRTRIHIQIPITEAELRDVRRDLERDLPNLNLPDGVTIELKGEEDD
jgi:hypothetical protein